jgi:hypothetical protein
MLFVFKIIEGYVSDYKVTTLKAEEKTMDCGI